MCRRFHNGHPPQPAIASRETLPTMIFTATTAHRMFLKSTKKSLSPASLAQYASSLHRERSPFEGSPPPQKSLSAEAVCNWRLPIIAAPRHSFRTAERTSRSQRDPSSRHPHRKSKNLPLRSSQRSYAVGRRIKQSGDHSWQTEDELDDCWADSRVFNCARESGEIIHYHERRRFGVCTFGTCSLLRRRDARRRRTVIAWCLFVITTLRKPPPNLNSTKNGIAL